MAIGDDSDFASRLTNTTNHSTVAKDVFEEMDHELTFWLQSDATVVGPLKCLAGWGGSEVLRRGLGKDCFVGLPQRCSRHPLSSVSLVPGISQASHNASNTSGSSGRAAGPAARGFADSCLARLLQTIDRMSEAGDVPAPSVPPRPRRLQPASPASSMAMAAMAWRPSIRTERDDGRDRQTRQAGPHAGSSGSSFPVPGGDEALAVQLQFGDEGAAVAAWSPEPLVPGFVPAPHLPEPPGSRISSIDEALALALSIADMADADEWHSPHAASDFRAEARRRVRARRTRGRAFSGQNRQGDVFLGREAGSPFSEPEQTGTEHGEEQSPDDSDGFYSRLWGLDGQTFDVDVQRSRRRTSSPVILMGTFRHRRPEDVQSFGTCCMR